MKYKGLSKAEVEKRRQEFGENRLQEKKSKSFLMRFLNQFKDVMIIILLIAAAISFAIACSSGESSEFFESILIVMIVVLNAIMGVIQESKAEKALEALKSLSSPNAFVIRDGKEQIVPASELVPGDIIKIEAGDFIPADAKLLECASLKCDESTLTGESVPVDKQIDEVVDEKASLGDKKNMIFTGCSATYGRGYAEVVKTGMNTEIGKIANLLNDSEKTQTPLQVKLAKLGKYLGFGVLLICAIVFVVGLFGGMELIDIFMTSVSLAVSAIPEGLPAIVTIVLSIGVQRMVKRNAIIRRLPAVETLGSASIICSDKTGTLTQNDMTVTKIYLNEGEKESRLYVFGALCTDARIVEDSNGLKKLGDPTETAIAQIAYDKGFKESELRSSYKRLAEIPFDSDRKLMTTVNEIDGKIFVIVKGAFDKLSTRCIKGDLTRAGKKVDEMGQQALRVLAVAYKEITDIAQSSELNLTIDSATLESELTFLGLFGMIDPPRPEVRKAVKVCKSAGIRPIMITGDYVTTASAIAWDLGIMRKNDRAITGQELSDMSDEQLAASVEEISVYARVTPEDKIRIVKAWQKRGEVVSMTGDGVNDAPALKAADIGCAMGKVGTDVAKGAADIILTDDNFATIVDAVREGRGIYANIKKVIGFLLGTNLGEVFTVFLVMLLWKQTPLLSMQLLWINLVTDSLPAISLGMEAVEKDIMSQKPKSKDEGIFSDGLWFHVLLQGFMFAILTISGFVIGKSATGTLEGGQTMAFFILALTQIVQAYNMRSTHSLFKIGPFSNKKLNGAALVSIILIAIVLFSPLSIVFKLVYLPAHLYAIGALLALAPLAIMEIVKLFKKPSR